MDNNIDDTLLEFSPVNETSTENIDKVFNNDNNVVPIDSVIDKSTVTPIDEVIKEEVTPISEVIPKKEEVISPIVNIVSKEESIAPISDVINQNSEPITPINEVQNNEVITPITNITEAPTVIEKSESNETTTTENQNDDMITPISNIPEVPTMEKSEPNEVTLPINEEMVKESKPKKLSKYVALLPIFAFFSTLILGLYVFTNNTKADESNLIKIEKQNKIGYINYKGEVIIPPKYLSGTDYYKGRAIVKNESNMLGVLDNKNTMVSAFGNFFYIERFSNRYIASKFTSNGLKLALLNSDMEELTKYKYDNITYAKDNSFIFIRNNTMGILNDEGREIYSYEASDIDDKKIDIEISKITKDDEKSKYARIKLNDSSTIVNLQTGKEVYKYTLDNIFVLDNNVFYISTKYADSNNRYLVIKNDKIAYQTNNYLRVRIDDYDSDIIIGVKEDVTYDYIDIKTKKVINDNNTYDYSYGDGIILKKEHDFETTKDTYEIIVKGKVKKKIEDVLPVTGEFKNGYLKVFVGENKYNFIDTSGKLISEEKYDSATDFNSFGYSIVSKDGSYGVISNNGEVVLPTKYNEISFIDSSLFKTMKDKYKKAVFIYSINGQKGLLNQDGNTIVKAIYDDFKYITTKYPMILGTTELDDVLINLDTNKEYSINIKDEPVIFDNYFIVGPKYYNYDGKKIYDSSQED